MSELAIAIGLVLVIEGLVWAVMPRTALKMLEAAAQTPETTLRGIGAAVMAAGVLMVWLVRG